MLQTPLGWGLRYKAAEVVELLLEIKADPKTTCVSLFILPLSSSSSSSSSSLSLSLIRRDHFSFSSFRVLNFLMQVVKWRALLSDYRG